MITKILNTILVKETKRWKTRKNPHPLSVVMKFVQPWPSFVPACWPHSCQVCLSWLLPQVTLGTQLLPPRMLYWAEVVPGTEVWTSCYSGPGWWAVGWQTWSSRPTWWTWWLAVAAAAVSPDLNWWGWCELRKVERPAAEQRYWCCCWCSCCC